MKATRLIAGYLALAAMCLVANSGCGSQKDASGAPANQSSGGLFSHVQKTGAQIWAENCTRCHTPRPAAQYTPQQWDLITTHMRLRCNLTGEEQRAVYHFMAGN